MQRVATPATSLGRFAPLHKETRAPATQLLEACAGRQGDGWLRRLRREQAAADSSGEGCSDLIASAGRALQLEQVELQKRLPRESCGCTGLSPKLETCSGGHIKNLASGQFFLVISSDRPKPPRQFWSDRVRVNSGTAKQPAQQPQPNPTTLARVRTEPNSPTAQQPNSTAQQKTIDSAENYFTGAGAGGRGKGVNKFQ